MDLTGYLRRIMNSDANETFAPATDSLEAISDLITGGGGISGMGFMGIVTAVPGANQFTIPTLAGHGETAFVGWGAFVFWDAGGAGAAPQGELQAVTAYVDATGIFTTAAFTAPVAVGDIILILNPLVAEIATLIARLTAARAGYLDRIKNLTRPQNGTQATTAALATVGAAIINTVPIKVSGLLSLNLMQAGDTFLVIEEIRDQDDATYREYGRTAYAGVQVSPMIWFEEKVCQGWRVRIQRTAGVDRNVTYQYFTEVASA